MPINKYFQGHGSEVMKNMKQEYGPKKGESVFYATANKRNEKPGKDETFAKGSTPREAAGLSVKEWNALPSDQRRKLIENFKAAQDEIQPIVWPEEMTEEQLSGLRQKKSKPKPLARATGFGPGQGGGRDDYEEEGFEHPAGQSRQPRPWEDGLRDADEQLPVEQLKRGQRFERDGSIYIVASLSGQAGGEALRVTTAKGKKLDFKRGDTVRVLARDEIRPVEGPADNIAALLKKVGLGNYPANREVVKAELDKGASEKEIVMELKKFKAGHAKDAEREPDQSDLNAAARGLKMNSLSVGELSDLIKELQGYSPSFANKASLRAAKQILAAKKRAGARDDIPPVKSLNQSQQLEAEVRELLQEGFAWKQIVEALARKYPGQKAKIEALKKVLDIPPVRYKAVVSGSKILLGGRKTYESSPFRSRQNDGRGPCQVKIIEVKSRRALDEIRPVSDVQPAIVYRGATIEEQDGAFVVTYLGKYLNAYPNMAVAKRSIDAVVEGYAKDEEHPWSPTMEREYNALRKKQNTSALNERERTRLELLSRHKAAQDEIQPIGEDEHEGFAKLEGKFKKEGKSDPGGLAYAIGVEKYGKAGMEKKAAAGKAKDGSGVRIVYNRLLGGWYVVRGPHQTPLSGRFNSKEEALASLGRAKDGKLRPV